MPNNANIDERVVEMRIDNRQFVSGAEKTISVLDKLKKALSFGNATDGFDAVQKSVDRVDLSGMAKDIDAISDRFSSMGIVGMRVLENLTDKITSFLGNTIKGLTIDPISEGFSKYEETARAVATILSATREEVGKWGIGTEFDTQLDYVKDGLETLMWYADETSAAYTDMVANVTKFVNSGIGFDKAVVEMMGITNWGYSAGAGKGEQARAMYNLSQAMASGSVKLMDWRSIENANMATSEFKNTVLDTAVQLGHLKKVSEGVYTTIDGKTKVTAQNFAQTLQEGWFGSDVLEKTLIVYGEFSRRLDATMSDLHLDEYNVSADELMKTIDKIQKGDMSLVEWQAELSSQMESEDIPTLKQLKYAYALLTNEVEGYKDAGTELTQTEFELSRRAMEAGYEYRTFSDVIDAVKDSVSSQWMKTFEYILGDAEQAKDLWSSIGEELLNIFGSAGSFRNKVLKIWNDPIEHGIKGVESGRDMLLRALGTLYNGVKTYITPIIEAFHSVFNLGDNPKQVARTLLDLTERFEKWTGKVALSEEATTGMKLAFEKLFDAVKTGLGYLKPIFSVFGKLIGYVKSFVELFFGSFYEVVDGDTRQIMFDTEKFFGGLSDIFKDIVDGAKAAWGGIKSFADQAWKGVKSFGDSLKGIPVVGTVFNGFTSAVDWIVEKFVEAKDAVVGMVNGSFKMEEPLKIIEDLWDKIVKWISEADIDTDSIKEGFGQLGEIVSTVWEGIVGDSAAFRDKIKNAALTAIGGIKDALSSIKVSDVFEGAKTGTLLYIGLQFAQFVTTFKDSAKKFNSIPESIAGAFNSLSKTISAYGQKYKGDYMLKMAAAILAVAAAMWILAKVDQKRFAEVAVTLAFFFAILGSVAKNLSKINSDAKLFSGNITVFSKFSTAIVAVAILLGIAAVALLALSKLTWNEIQKGLATMGIVLLAAVVTIVALSKTLEEDINLKAIGKLVAVAVVIKAAGKAMSKLAKMNWSQILSAGFALGIVIAAVALAMKAMGSASAGSAIGSIGAAISVIAVMYMMVPLLLGIGAYIKKFGGENLVSSMLVLVLIGGILVAFTAIMAHLGKGGGLVAGAAAMTLIGVAFVAFAAALTLSAPAILLLLNGVIDVMERLSTMEGAGTITLLLLGIGAALIVISVAAGIFGAAALLAGAGMSLFGIGILAVASAIALLTVVLVPFGYALTEFCNMVAENGKVLVSIVAAIITGIMLAILASRMKIAYTTILVILAILEVIHEFGPQILVIVATLLEDVMKFVVTLIPMLVKFLLLTIISLVDSLANAIRSSADALVSAIENLVSAILELFLKVLIQMAGDMLGGIWSLIAGFLGMDQSDIDAVASEIQKGAKELGDYTAGRVNVAFGGLEREATGGASAMVDSFVEETTGRRDDLSGAVEEVISGIKEKVSPTASKAGDDIGSDYITSFTNALGSGSAMKDMGLSMDNFMGVLDQSENANVLGTNTGVGYANGLIAEEGDNEYAGRLIAWAQQNGYVDEMGISSPSKVAYKLSGYFAQGLINGIDDSVSDVANSSSSLAFKMADAVRSALATVQSLAEDDFDISPRITPVVDMTNVDTAASSVNGMFSSGIAGRISQVGRSMANLDAVANDMRSLSEARSNISQDVYEVNVYSQPGMDEEMLADAVIYRLSNGVVRKGVALG